MARVSISEMDGCLGSNYYHRLGCTLRSACLETNPVTTALAGITKEGLIAFEERVKQAFLDKQIHAPVHLSGGNEEQLIEIFKDVRDKDWVFSTWRSHYHALLKGIPEEELFKEILAGRSMYLNNARHKFVCSSIVGGILPIACGVALGAKLKGLDEKIWVFVGDMTARTGIYHEFVEYCRGFDLPVSVVIEDNHLSTNTPTSEAWGLQHAQIPIHRYKYERQYPHVGVGTFVAFG